MLTVVISLVISAVLLFWLGGTKIKRYDLTIIIGGVLLIGAIISTSPIYGYKEAYIEEEIELVSLYEEKEVYVSEYLNDVYMYKYMTENKPLPETNIIKGFVVVNEEANCTKPILRKIVKEPKKGLFSFCYMKEKFYEFNVPIGMTENINVSIN